MPKPRKRHVQTELHLPTWGGKRKGAGRPAKGPRPSEKHGKRPRLRADQPVHVVLRVAKSLGSLRRRDMYKALREATITVLKLEDFRIVHLSIQGTHVHLLVEAANRMKLARGMQSFQISAAKQLNRSCSEFTGKRRKGQVFVDRYHSRILKTPREVRNCVAYVLNNWRHHGEHDKSFAKNWKVDPYSSSWQFGGWKERADAETTWKPPTTYESLVVWLPKTWLLREGWRKHGLISTHEVPGGAPS